MYSQSTPGRKKPYQFNFTSKYKSANVANIVANSDVVYISSKVICFLTNTIAPSEKMTVIINKAIHMTSPRKFFLYLNT